MPFWNCRSEKIARRMEQLWMPIWLADSAVEGAVAAVSPDGQSADIYQGELTLSGKQFADLTSAGERLIWREMAPFPVEEAQEGELVEVNCGSFDPEKPALLASAEAKDRLCSALVQEARCGPDQEVQFKAFLANCTVDCVLSPIWRYTFSDRMGPSGTVWVDGAGGRATGSLEAGFLVNLLTPSSLIAGLAVGVLAFLVGVGMW